MNTTTITDLMGVLLDDTVEALALIDENPAYAWRDLTKPPRLPALTCDAGAVAVWLGPALRSDGIPGQRARTRCLTLLSWEVNVRWWTCFPSLTDDGGIDPSERDAASVRIASVGASVGRTLAAWACAPPEGWRVAFESATPVIPAGGSGGFDWRLSAVR